MDIEETDVVVIGMGPGGEYAAGVLAEAGLHVTGVEARLLGGECPYWGCVPSKMMIRAANLLAEGRRIPGMAGTSTVSPDWAPVARRIRDEATDSWDDKVAVERFTGKGGHFVRGRGRITAAGEVTVDTADGARRFRASRAILINPGTEPARPPVPGLADTPYWTNRDAIETEDVPESLIVLGGGAIGAELAQVFARFGARVTVVEALPRLVPMEEPEASDLLAKVFTREGITVRTGARAENISHDGNEFTLSLPGGETLSSQRLLVATGRRTDLAALGVATLGLDGPLALYRAVPRVTFTDPEIGSVGLTEAQAEEQGLAVRTSITQVPTSARGWIHKAGNDGFVKLVENAERGVLVGATCAGPAGGEVLGALVVAVHGQVPVPHLRNMMYAYPTFHRAIESALDELNQG